MARTPSLTDIAKRVLRIQAVAASKKTQKPVVSKKAPAKSVPVKSAAAKKAASGEVKKPKKAAPKGMTLDQLLDKTISSRIAQAKNHQVTVIQFATYAKGQKIKSKTMTKDRDNGKIKLRPHFHWVKKLTADDPAATDKDKAAKFSGPNTKIQVRCDCIVGDTKLLTDKGWKTASSLARPHIPGKYTINYNINGNLHVGSAPYSKGVQKVWRVDFTNGESVTVTSGQKFLVRFRAQIALWRGNKFVKHEAKAIRRWIKLKDLSVGDQLAMPEFSVPEINRNQDFFEAFYIGTLMGDGSLFASGKPDLRLYKKDSLEIIDMLRNADVVRDYVPLRDGGYRVQFNERARHLMLKYKFKNKQSVKITNREQLLGYLSGLLITDGCFGPREANVFGGRPYIQQLMHKLIEYGYPHCAMKLSREKGVATNLGVATKDMMKLYISALDLRNMADSLYLTEAKAKVLNGVISRAPKNRPAYTVVSDITYVGEEEVFDITVPNIERFVANGVILHNCSDFAFMWEYALTRKNASSIKYSNGEFPIIRNPRLIPGLCKHLYVLLKYIRTKRL